MNREKSDCMALYTSALMRYLFTSNPRCCGSKWCDEPCTASQGRREQEAKKNVCVAEFKSPCASKLANLKQQGLSNATRGVIVCFSSFEWADLSLPVICLIHDTVMCVQRGPLLTVTHWMACWIQFVFCRSLQYYWRPLQYLLKTNKQRWTRDTWDLKNIFISNFLDNLLIQSTWWV